MSKLKVIVALALVAGIAASAGAAGIPFQRAYNGPVVMDVIGNSSGTLYTGFLADGVTPMDPGVTYDPADLEKSPDSGMALNAGEDGFGVFYISNIYEGTINPGTQEVFQTGPTVWSEALDTKYELVGAYYGRTDIAVTIDPGTGDQVIESVGDRLQMWLQPKNTYFSTEQVPLKGEAGRLTDGNGVYLDKYDGVGYDANGDPIGELVLTAETSPGFIGEDPNAETVVNFEASSSTGNGRSFADVTGGTDAYKFVADDGIFEPFKGAGFDNADLNMRWNFGVLTNSGWLTNFNDPIGAYVIPEPVTMFSAVLAIGGLGGYLRRRRNG